MDGGLESEPHARGVVCHREALGQALRERALFLPRFSCLKGGHRCLTGGLGCLKEDLGCLKRGLRCLEEGLNAVSKEASDV